MSRRRDPRVEREVHIHLGEGTHRYLVTLWVEDNPAGTPIMHMQNLRKLKDESEEHHNV